MKSHRAQPGAPALLPWLGTPSSALLAVTSTTGARPGPAQHTGPFPFFFPPGT